MEVLREGCARREEGIRGQGFNPCFNGSVERGMIASSLQNPSTLRFNPCFNGSVERGSKASL